MDLKECTGGPVHRHPWERARVEFLRTILKNNRGLSPFGKVLDIGCGDAFAVTKLWEEVPAGHIDAVDVNFSGKKMADLSAAHPHVTFYKTVDMLERKHYDAVTLLDVLEHVEEDEGLLREARNYLKDDGQALVTVPAFAGLFGKHDAFLGHYRRYNRRDLLGVIGKAGLHCTESGYMFPVLLPIRAFSVMTERVTAIRMGRGRGVGGWNRNRPLSAMLTWILIATNRIGLLLHARGLDIPGLSLWALCRKRR